MTLLRLAHLLLQRGQQVRRSLVHHDIRIYLAFTGTNERRHTGATMNCLPRGHTATCYASADRQ